MTAITRKSGKYNFTIIAPAEEGPAPRRRDINGMVHTVIRKCTAHAYDEPTTSNRLRASPRTVVSVLPQQTSILFVNADGALDYNSASVMADECARLPKLLELKLSIGGHRKDG